MGSTLETVVFYFLAAFIIAMSIMTVTTQRIVRSANQPDVFREFLGDYDRNRVKFMVTQKVGDEFEEGMKILRELYTKAKTDVRARTHARTQSLTLSFFLSS